MGFSISALLFLSLLYPLSSSHPQAQTDRGDGYDMHGDRLEYPSWKMGGLSFRIQKSSAISGRFLLFEPKSMPCENDNPIVWLFNPVCMLSMSIIMARKVPWNENGIVCQNESNGRTNSTSWFTCDKRIKSGQAAEAVKLPKSEIGWRKWRIYDIKDGDYVAGSIPIYKSSSQVQSDVRRGFYSAKLEIMHGGYLSL
jgi:hypothetical protein